MEAAVGILEVKALQLRLVSKGTRGNDSQTRMIAINAAKFYDVVDYLHAVRGGFVLHATYNGSDVRGVAVTVVDDEFVIAVELPALGLARLVAHEVVIVILIEIAV